MRFPSVATGLVAVFLVPVALVSNGCDLFGEEFGVINVPIPLSSPSVDLDVGTPVGEAIDSSCSTPDSASCTGIAALCNAEEGADCDPPTLPPQFPKEVEIEGQTTSADDVMPDAVVEATRLKFAVPVDLTELLATAGVDKVEQVKNVTLDEVFLNWEENDLTFDAPVLDVYVGPIVDGSETLDPEALIGRSGFEKIGSVGLDTDDDSAGFDVGQVAETTGKVPLEFAAGGNEKFNERLKSFAFTMVLVAPEGQELHLKEVAGNTSKVKRPDGAAKIKLDGNVTYEVNLAEAAGIE